MGQSISESALHAVFTPAVTGKYDNQVNNPSPDRLMLYRYDLATGNFLSTVRIKTKTATKSTRQGAG